jgi:hypothetical protein
MQGEQRLTDFGDRWIELRLILGKTVSLLLRNTSGARWIPLVDT